jgi:hypothetical protein
MPSHTRKVLEHGAVACAVQAAILTLLGLIIGFSFSMAVSRYDLRKTYKDAEANAIGTEYVRAGPVPAANAAGFVRAKKIYRSAHFVLQNPQ